MKKQIRRFKVPFNFDWTYGVEIKKLREDLDQLEKLGVTTIEIEAEESYGSSSVTIEAFVNRLETDEELKSRINEENRREEEQKSRELQELERLKTKYGQ